MQLTYCLELLLQITDPAFNIVWIVNVILSDFEITTRALKHEIDELGHSGGVVTIVSSDPQGSNII